MNEPAGKPSVALIIDDEPQIRRLLRVTLEANAYQVFEITIDEGADEVRH